MLQNIRDRATGWIAWVIIILIIIPFAFWGLDKYLQNDSQRLVASIDDAEITVREFQNNLQQQKQRVMQAMGRVDPGLFDRPEFKRKLLDKMITDQLMSTTVVKENYRIPDALLAQEIQFSPSFMTDGHFDSQKYDRMLRAQGETPASFEHRLRVAMAVDQLRLGVAMSEPVLPNELDQLIRLDRQERQVAWLRLSLDTFRDPAQVTDAEIQSYFDAHRDAFRTEERVKLAYIELSVAGLAKEVAVTDAALHKYFDDHQDHYVRPEQREASHIMIAVAQGADDATVAAARTRIEALRERIEAGEDFAKVAESASEDVSTAKEGGALGIVDRGMMGDAFDQALYGLTAGEVSEPVRTDFGWHLIKVTKIHPAGSKTFADARDQVEADYRHAQAEDQFYALGEKLADVSYSHPDNLQSTADETGLKVQSTDLLTRKGASEGLFANPKVMQAAFSDDVLVNGQNSEVIEVAPDDLVVLRVLQHDEAQPKPLAEVRDEVRTRIATERAGERVREVAEQMAKTLRDGGDVADRAGLARHAADWYRRGDNKLDAPVALAAFELPRPATAQRSVGVTPLANGDFAVVEVTGVRDGKPGDVSDELRKTYRTSLSRLGSEHMLADLIAQLRVEREIKVYDNNL